MGEEEGEQKRYQIPKVPVATEKMIELDPAKMMKKMLPRERDSALYKSMQDIYHGEAPMDVTDHKMYKRGGIQQSRTKMEFSEAGRKIAMERGIPSYNREVGIPLGQRTMETYPVGTMGGKLLGHVTYDDINFFNMTAMQQCADDIKRTVIVNLDVPHRTIQLRLGKEISPETMNLFMETLQHKLAGGAVLQEHMSEIHPGLTKDAFGKIFTGDDELAEQFDRRFKIDLNKDFHPKRAEMLKVGIGNKLCCALHESTLRVRMMDGGAIVRSAAQGATMALVATYRLTGESVLSDIAYSTRHAQQIRMGEPMWQSRSRAPNEIGGIPFGYYADICASEIDFEPTPVMEYLAQGAPDFSKFMGAVGSGGGMWVELLTNLWYGQYMAGGIGFNAAGYSILMGGSFIDIEALTGGGLEGDAEGEGGTNMFSAMGSILGGHERMPAKWKAIKPFIHMVSNMVMDQYDKYPTMMEMSWGGAIRTFAVGYAGSMVAAMFSGDAQLTQMAANYGVALGLKEGWLRTGWSGQEVQHHVGLAYAASVRPEEGGLPELKGPNVPYMSYTVGALGFPMFCYMAMIARGSAWAASPLVKVTFSDPDLAFNFRNPLEDMVKGALREFEPQGERDVIRPAK